ncbi:MAG: hypothetical protein ABR582_09710 [Gemmatimonadaceae bacterium]
MKGGLTSLVAMIFCATGAGAQAQADTTAKPVDAEMRLDGIISRVPAAQLGVGLMATAGYYVRIGADGALGFSQHGLSGRIDGLARFHFDPFRQSRWAPYGGGGISGRFEKREKGRAYLLVFLGMDGPIEGSVTPSLELGLGGGARIGIILRQSRKERR